VIGRPRRSLASCASTNDEAASWAREGAPEGAMVVADAQTKGRGRLGRVWHSPPRENLYLSIVLRPAVDTAKVPPLTLAVGVALAETVASLGVDCELKWPNDVLVDGKKVAGILCEMSGASGKISHVIVGIGVNLNTEQFPEALTLIATSLRRAKHGELVDRDAFVDTLSLRLDEWYARFIAKGPTPIVDAWLTHANLTGRDLVIRNGTEELRGRAEGLDQDGTLLLRTRDGTLHRVVAGEIANAT